MAELAETRRVPDAPEVARDAHRAVRPLPLVGTAEYRPGGYEHPRSRTYPTYHSQHVPTSFCKAFQDCASCHDVGTEAATFGAIVGAGCRHSKANTGASVGTEGKRGNYGNSNCIGDGAKASNRVGPVGNRNNCSSNSNDSLGNGVNNSNGARFSDGDFPKLIASKIDVGNN